MAKNNLDKYSPLVGRYVYRAFKPLFIGKVVAVLPQGTILGYYKPSQVVEIKWESGTITKEDVSNLLDVEGLIQDHERKVQTHKKNLTRVKAII